MADEREDRREERDERREDDKRVRDEIERDRKLEDSLDESIANLSPRDYFDLVSDLQDSKEDEDRFSKIIVDLPRHYKELYDDRERQKARAEEMEIRNKALKEENRRYWDNIGRTRYDVDERREDRRDERERFGDYRDEEEKRVSLSDIFKERK